MESDMCLHDISINYLFDEFQKCKNEKESIVAYFLASLSSHNLLWRSFLPAYAITTTYPFHHFEPKNDEMDSCGEYRCKICLQKKYIGLNKTDYEFYLSQAIQNGGINLPSIEYYIVLLHEFNKREKQNIKPVLEDIVIFQKIMDTIIHADLKDVLKKSIVRKIRGISNFKITNYQIQCLLHTLGFCGVLETKTHLSPFHGFQNLPFAPKRTYNSDWAYPVDFWEPSDGINKDALKYWFGNYSQLEQYWK